MSEILSAVRTIEGAKGTIVYTPLGWEVRVPLETCSQVLIRTCCPEIGEAALKALADRARADAICRGQEGGWVGLNEMKAERTENIVVVTLPAEVGSSAGAVAFPPEVLDLFHPDQR